MNKPYTFASLNGHEEMLKDIARLERELSQKTGEEVVLIAYTKKEADSNSPFATI